MTLLSNEQKVKLHRLYNQRRFSELELEIEIISDAKTRSAFLSNLLGVAKLRKKDNDENKDWLGAKNSFLDSYQKDPSYIDALCNYAHVSVKLRDYKDAYEKLILKKKDGYNAKINEALARIYFFEGDVDKELELFKENEKNNDLNRITASHFLSSLNYSSKYTQKDYLDYCTRVENKFIITEAELSKLDKINVKNELNVGFISPDFKEHSVFYFLNSTLSELKKNLIKVYLFNIRDYSELDGKSKILKNNCDEWVDLYNLTDTDAVNEIRKKNINILFDITGHFARNRINLFKYKPAPIQISWMGYVNSTGLKEIDYIITDKNLIKKGEENLYTEKILRLKQIWNCHQGFDEKLDINKSPFLKNGYLTFGCFNNTVKISHECIKVWSKILNQIPDSKLIIKAVSKDAELAQIRILQKFSEFGIDTKRITFEKTKKERIDHLKMYSKVDITLDTFPYPGVTTSFESIWMGVPVLTKNGNNFVSRCGESINLNLGLKDYIAKNDDDYVMKAVLLNKDRDALPKLRSSIREIAKKTPLFDTISFGKEFSLILKKVWQSFKDESS
tara:strand:- start:104 stop:1789 length:1686 start_codon:yes stop_codon:yes gene_type:complete